MTVEDIKRLNHIKYTACRELVGNPHGIIYYVLRFLLISLKSVVLWKGSKLTIKEVLFFVTTINNIKSVQNIINGLPKERITIWGLEFSKLMPYSKICLLSLIYFHLFVKLYLSSSREDRLLIRAFYFDFLTACASYKVFEGILMKNPQLKLIILANDHSLINRILIELAEKHGIKSLYVQHASVTTAFPPLRFDYAFLDGRESYEKYKTVGNMRGCVFLTGSPRFDAFHNYQGADKMYDIGIALNELDSEDQVLQLCLYLKEHYSTKIIVRPHPGMLIPNNLLFHEEKFVEQGFSISNPKKDLSYVFISQINVMLANESGIHLDAALMGVPSLLYNFSDNEVMDWYSFIKIGLIKKCDTFEDVVRMLDSGYHLPIDIVRYYAASFKTTHDGRVGEMIATFVNKLILESETEALAFVNGEMIQGTEYAEYRN